MHARLESPFFLASVPSVLTPTLCSPQLEDPSLDEGAAARQGETHPPAPKWVTSTKENWTEAGTIWKTL